MTADLNVLLNGEHAGTITKNSRDRGATLEYDPAYASTYTATPLSLAFPLRIKTHQTADWLDGLLPPSLELRQQIGRAHRARSQHPVDLLATGIGMDCAGAVQFVPVVQVSSDSKPSRASGLDFLTEGRIEGGLVALRRGAVAWEQRMGRPLSFSLSGAQTKIALHRTEPEEWHLPYGDVPSTHILKIELPSYPDNIIIEHLCMRALRSVGIPAAHTEVVQFGDERAICVARFDRYRSSDEEMHRRHQEDLCQATGTTSHQKQQWAGGPPPRKIADLLWGESDAADASVRRFADGLIANWVLLASDAHAKNYSVTLMGSSARLAPLYDVCSEVPWRTDTEMPYIQMAMRSGDSFDASEMGVEEWAACAADLRLPVQEVLDRVEYLAAALPVAVVGAAEALTPEFRNNEHVERLIDVMQNRAGSCSSILAQPVPSIEGRCQHTGVRSRRRCILPLQHQGLPHRYQR